MLFSVQNNFIRIKVDCEVIAVHSNNFHTYVHSGRNLQVVLQITELTQNKPKVKCSLRCFEEK